MDHQNRFKNRISRMFRGSFGSCRTRDLSDVIEKTVFVPQKMESLPSKNKPIPSMCRPDPSMNINSIISCKKIPQPYPHCIPLNTGYSCLPASPAAPFILNQGKKTKDKSSFKRKNKKRDYTAPLSSSSQGSVYYADKYYLFSSGDEEEEDDDNDESDAFFSSRSTTLTSDSSGSYYRSTSRRRRRKGSRKKRSSTNIRRRASKIGVLPVMDCGDGGGKVKDSFAVVKRSSDPYNDFRTSMVEMIVEKQIFSSTELEKLLQCFLSLNSCHHHKIIVEVFMEIWETLFSHWS